jgi:hypothetical protein
MADRVGRPIARRSRTRTSAAVSTVAAAVAILSIVLAPAASAGGYIVSDTYFCSDGLISIKPPRTWTNNARPEQVYWAPVYYQWQGSKGWVAIAHNDWAIATVNNQGYAVVGWTDTVHYYGVGSRSMGVNQAGYYAVANYLVWTSDASTLFQFASPPDSRGYCTFTTRTVGAGRDALVAPADGEDGPLGFADQLIRPAREIVSLYLDATIAQAPAPSGPGPATPAA